ncbi:MAG: MerR family DNA-binding protein [Betaproteobacteria bacterium]|nr:MerR family DNA-binding protein [Betaproteobacteria bacterium]
MRIFPVRSRPPASPGGRPAFPDSYPRHRHQRIGLLALPRRDHGSIRRYSANDLKRVRFIKRAQALGFSLDEVALLLGLSNGRHCAETKSLAERKLAMVEEKIADLAAIQRALKGLVTRCAKGSRGCGCPIIDALVQDEAPSGKGRPPPASWK